MEKSLFVDKKKRAYNYLTSGISGILLAASFPVADYYLFAWFALVPVLLKISDSNRLQAFWMGFVCGMVFYLFTLYWIVNTMVDYGGMSRLSGYGVLLILVAYLSIFFGLFCFILRIAAGKSTLYKWFYSPFIWVLLEFARGILLTGFPWATLGYSQYRFTAMIQVADITGVYGISYLIILVNATAAYAIEHIVYGSSDPAFLHRRHRLSVKPVVLTAMIVSLSYFYGLLRIEESKTKKKADSISVRVVQGNVEQDKKWDPVYKAEVFDKYKNLTLSRSFPKRPDIIVWPETATPFYFPRDSEYTPMMFDLSERSGSSLFFGSPRYERDTEGGVDMFNSAYMIYPSGKTEGPYDKIHLVPFGEYVPLRRMLWFIDKLVEGIGEFRTGSDLTLFHIKDIPFSAIICFEIIYPDLVRRFVKKGARFLVNITNDAWFGRSAASYQHIAMVAFRAVENRVFVVRAANTGISGFITPAGEILDPTDIFTEAVIQRDIVPKDRVATFYSVYGDIFVYTCMAFFISSLVIGAVKKDTF